MCKTTICPKAFNTLPHHGLNQCHQIPFRYGVPLLPAAETGRAEQGLLLVDGCRKHGGPGCSRGAQLVPYQGTGHLILVTCCNTLAQWGEALQCGENKALYDLISVPHTGQIALHEVKRSPAVKRGLPIPSMTLLHDNRVGKHASAKRYPGCLQMRSLC